MKNLTFKIILLVLICLINNIASDNIVSTIFGNAVNNVKTIYEQPMHLHEFHENNNNKRSKRALTGDCLCSPVLCFDFGEDKTYVVRFKIDNHLETDIQVNGTKNGYNFTLSGETFVVIRKNEGHMQPYIVKRNIIKIRTAYETDLGMTNQGFRNNLADAERLIKSIHSNYISGIFLSEKRCDLFSLLGITREYLSIYDGNNVARNSLFSAFNLAGLWTSTVGKPGSKYWSREGTVGIMVTDKTVVFKAYDNVYKHVAMSKLPDTNLYEAKSPLSWTTNSESMYSMTDCNSGDFMDVSHNDRCRVCCDLNAGLGRYFTLENGWSRIHPLIPEPSEENNIARN